MPEDLPLTKTGSLKPHLAAAICYMPLMYVHFFGSIVFLVSEPKEHGFVRRHAAQSLLLTATWIGSTVLFLVLMFVTPMVFILIGAMLSGISEELGALMMFVGIGGEILFGIIAIADSFAGIVALMGMTLASAMEKDIRLPVLGGLAARLVGDEG